MRLVSKGLSSETQEDLRLSLLARWCKPNLMPSVNTLLPDRWSPDCVGIFILTSPYPSPKVSTALPWTPAPPAAPSPHPVTTVGSGSAFDSYPHHHQFCSCSLSCTCVEIFKKTPKQIQIPWSSDTRLMYFMPDQELGDRDPYLSVICHF